MLLGAGCSRKERRGWLTHALVRAYGAHLLGCAQGRHFENRERWVQPLLGWRWGEAAAIRPVPFGFVVWEIPRPAGESAGLRDDGFALNDDRD